MTTRNPSAAASKPGPQKQPIRVPTGAGYGEAGAMQNQQQAAPMAAGGPTAPPPPGSGGGAPAPGGAFGPTERPLESNSAMPPPLPSPSDNPDAVLRAMYAAYPSQYLSRLIGTMPNPTPEAPAGGVPSG